MPNTDTQIRQEIAHFDEPLTLTFAKAKSEGACDVSYRKMVKHLGGVTKYGLNTPVPIETILDVCGFGDAVWALWVVIERGVAEGFRAIGIEKEEEYAQIIAHRLSQLSLFADGAA